MLSVKEIVEKFIRENNFDGVYSDVCGCLVDDLAPCGEMQETCRAGYKKKCDCSENCDWHVGGTKDA